MKHIVLVFAFLLPAAIVACTPRAVDCRVEFLRAPDGGKDAGGE